MSNTVTISKIAIKLDYSPTLTVYSKMDEVGMALRHDFGHWERGPLSVDMRKLADHTRFLMRYNHCYFECNWPQNSQEIIDKAIDWFKKALKKFSITRITRSGVHIFAHRAAEISFDDLVLRFENKFHKPYSELPGLSDYTLHDSAYSVIVKHRIDGWKRNVQLGPMTKDEWFARNSIDLKLYDLETESPIQTIKSKIPPVLYYCSIDTFSEVASVDTSLRETECANVFETTAVWNLV